MRCQEVLRFAFSCFDKNDNDVIDYGEFLDLTRCHSHPPAIPRDALTHSSYPLTHPLASSHPLASPARCATRTRCSRSTTNARCSNSSVRLSIAIRCASCPRDCRRCFASFLPHFCLTKQPATHAQSTRMLRLLSKISKSFTANTRFSLGR